MSLTTTLFFGFRLDRNTQLYFDPEIAGGRGFSGVTGIANFSNGELPRVAGLSVNVGDAIDLNQLRGQGTPPPTAAVGFLPVPVIPEECN